MAVTSAVSGKPLAVARARIWSCRALGSQQFSARLSAWRWLGMGQSSGSMVFTFSISAAMASRQLSNGESANRSSGLVQSLR